MIFRKKNVLSDFNFKKYISRSILSIIVLFFLTYVLYVFVLMGRLGTVTNVLIFRKKPLIFQVSIVYHRILL